MKAFRANGTIRVGRFVKIDPSDNHAVLEADANERIWGVAQVFGREVPFTASADDPPIAANDGDNVAVYAPGEDVLIYIGSGGCTAGDLLKSDADGKGVSLAETAGSKEHAGAMVEETASENEFAKAVVHRETVTTET